MKKKIQRIESSSKKESPVFLFTAMTKKIPADKSIVMKKSRGMRDAIPGA